MERQKKNASGITLIALVVSIIVMLVLAGVSLNATVGENGIVTKAQEATLQHRIATELENLNLELAKMNIDTISSEDAIAIQDIASYLLSQGVIEDVVTTSAGQIAAGIDATTRNKYFFGVKGDNTYKITRETDGLLGAEFTTYTSGGDITGGYALVTEDSFNNDASLSEEEKGKFTITNDAEVVFMDTITGALSIYVAEGVHATVGIYADMTLTNQGIRRSAITIEPKGTLDMYIGEGVTVTVNSGLGLDASGVEPGKGGYSGINVPWYDDNGNGVMDDNEYAVLNIKGSGIINALGGNAGNGGSTAGGDKGGAGGGGAGAGIGGNGGDGGSFRKGAGASGKEGENCGLINIYGTTTVYAYGGAGGSSGQSEINLDDATGAGGYPGAGIGGGGAGGAGGTCCAGAGGYSGGQPEHGKSIAKNGLASVNAYNSYGNATHPNGQNYWNGGGYFNGPRGMSDSGIDRAQTCFGGFGGQGAWGKSHEAGSGGKGGLGGLIYVNNTSRDNRALVYAFNGNMYTDGTNYGDGLNQCPIYSQSGIITAKYELSDKYGESNTNFDYFDLVLLSNQTNVDKSGYENQIYLSQEDESKNNQTFINNRYLNIIQKLGIASNPMGTSIDLSTQGVGSGAGYIEVSNGHYYLCNESETGVLTPQ